MSGLPYRYALLKGSSSSSLSDYLPSSLLRDTERYMIIRSQDGVRWEQINPTAPDVAGVLVRLLNLEEENQAVEALSRSMEAGK